MEQKQLTQFTFYDLYWDLIKQSDDGAAGRLIRNICKYMFTDEPITEPQDDKENYFWSNIVDVLGEDKQCESSGKIPKTLNRKMRHFTFLDTYYKAKEDYKRRQGNIILNAVRTIRAYTPRHTARGKVNDKTLKRRAGIRTRVFGRTLGELFSYFGEQSELLERDFSHRLQDIEKEIEEQRLQEQEVENTKINSKWNWGK